MTSTLTAPISTPFFTGTSSSAVSALVPDVFDVSIGGIPFLLDTSKGGIRYSTVPLQRQAIDQGTSPGERSLNPQGLWRRSFETWDLGTGQTDADRGDSLDGRSNTSKGIDPWTRWQLSLLPDTQNAKSSANTNLEIVVAGSRVYVSDGQVLSYSTDPFAGTPTWTMVTGVAAAAITGLATDGFYVFVAQGASGVYITNTGVSTASSWKTGTADGIAYALSRVLVNSGAIIYNVTDSYTGGATALSGPLMTHANSNWTWIGHAEGIGFIYSAGTVGDKSVIYRTSILADASALATPVAAGVLPDGETVSGIGGYLGFVLIGTTRGVRFATSSSAGDLTIGPLIETNTTVRGFEGQGQFVWFTWETFDATDGGLGRLDLTRFVDTSTPAHASDLMVASTGAIGSPVTFSDKRLFAAQGVGIIAQSTDLVASGNLTTGNIRYGLVNDKTIVSVFSSIEVDATDTSVEIHLSNEGGSFVRLATYTTAGQATITADETTGAFQELKVVINRSTGTATLGARLTALTSEAYPRATSSMLIDAAVILSERVMPPGGGEYQMDVAATWNSLRDLWSSRDIASFQDLQRRESVIVDDLVFETLDPDQGRTGREGTVTVRMKVI